MIQVYENDIRSAIAEAMGYEDYNMDNLSSDGYRNMDYHIAEIREWAQEDYDSDRETWYEANERGIADNCPAIHCPVYTGSVRM